MIIRKAMLHYLYIVFLDIYMEDITGVDTARAIRKIDEDVKLIFITTSNEFCQ